MPDELKMSDEEFQELVRQCVLVALEDERRSPDFDHLTDGWGSQRNLMATPTGFLSPAQSTAAKQSTGTIDPDDTELITSVARARAQSVIKFNRSAADIVAKLGTEDGKQGTRRAWTLIGLSATLVLGTLALIWGVATADGADKLLAALPGLAVVLATFAVVGLVNPLQTIERDFVFRRWSDIIMASFLLQAGSWDPADNAQLRLASARSTKDFAALAIAYGTSTGKTLDTLTGFLNSAAEAGGVSDSDEETEILTVTNPGAQTANVGKGVADVQIVATGPKELAYAVSGQPAGIDIDAKTGVLSGTPTGEPETATTVVTVSSTADSASAAVTFDWVVEAGTPAETKPADPVEIDEEKDAETRVALPGSKPPKVARG